MNRLESWLLHLSTIALTVTGLGYAWMRYLMKPSDPFSVINHPWEPHFLSTHILAAPVLLVVFGLILHGHILYKITAGARAARRSGLVMIPLFVLMAVSGYLLQVIVSDFRKVLVWIHLVTGALWSLFYLGHQIASYAQRRARQNGGPRYRIPVQVLFLAIVLVAKSHAEPLEREVYSMGTSLRVVLLEEDREKALRDTEELIRVVDSVDAELSTWKPESELSRFNKTEIGRPFQVSQELFDVIHKAKEWMDLTGGAFDPGIGKLLKVWAIQNSFQIPGTEQIAYAMEESGLRHIAMDSETYTLIKRKDVHIDPGAFGKGEALDRAIELAEKQKMAPFMIDFGGQIVVHGGAQWSVAIAQPSNRLEIASEQLSITTGSVSTSGFSERSGKVDDRTINHILNPITGQPAEPFGSVTVWHSSALAADILSTALYVMGPAAGYEWAVRNRIAAAFIVNSPKKIRKTPEFKNLASLRLGG